MSIYISKTSLLTTLWIIAILFSTPLSKPNAYSFYSPFREQGNLSFEHYLPRVIAKFGDHRSSHIYGHKHTGIDIKGRYGEAVYAIGDGKVIHIFRDFPHTTIYIRHSIGTGLFIYSVYMHLEEIAVDIGDHVSKETKIGRLFNKRECINSNFNTPPHLHFEIRKDISDRGAATFTSMTTKELYKYCLDPLALLLTAKGEHNE